MIELIDKAVECMSPSDTDLKISVNLELFGDLNKLVSLTLNESTSTDVILLSDVRKSSNALINLQKDEKIVFRYSTNSAKNPGLGSPSHN